MNTSSVLNSLRGKFVVFDGPDGCGKTTQAKLFCDFLKHNEIPSSLIEAKKVETLSRIRSLLLDHWNGRERLCCGTEVLLNLAMLNQSFEECIAPLIKAGECVVADRWMLSTLVYQGYAGGFGVENVESMMLAMLHHSLIPYLMIVINTPLDLCLKRIATQTSDFVECHIDHAKIHEGFGKVKFPFSSFDVVYVPSFEDSIETVHSRIVETILDSLSL